MPVAQGKTQYVQRWRFVGIRVMSLMARLLHNCYVRTRYHEVTEYPERVNNALALQSEETRETNLQVRKSVLS